MIICHKNKIAYLGVPQTGSTFLHRELSKYDDLFVDNINLKHGRASDAIKLGAKGYEFILFVRNHIECHKSDWGLMKRVSNLGIDHINSVYPEGWKTKCLDFYKENPNSDKWIMSNLEKKRRGSTIFENYTDNNCHTTYLKYENFEQSCKILFDKLEKPLPDLSKKINSSDGMDLSIKKETIKQIIYIYQNEMEKFNYI